MSSAPTRDCTVGCSWRETQYIFLPAYMRWANSLLSTAHGSFMQVFTDGLAEQPGADLSRRKSNPKTLYARAFEYAVVGAATLEGW